MDVSRPERAAKIRRRRLFLVVGVLVAVSGMFAGSVLAKIVQPSRLMAQVRIAETQAKDVLIVQAATVDTRNGEIPGEVTRVDPSVVNGTVTVDVFTQIDQCRNMTPT